MRRSNLICGKQEATSLFDTDTDIKLKEKKKENIESRLWRTWVNVGLLANTFKKLEKLKRYVTSSYQRTLTSHNQKRI